MCLEYSKHRNKRQSRGITHWHDDIRLRYGVPYGPFDGAYRWKLPKQLVQELNRIKVIINLTTGKTRSYPTKIKGKPISYDAIEIVKKYGRRIGFIGRKNCPKAEIKKMSPDLVSKISKDYTVYNPGEPVITSAPHTKRWKK